MAIWGSTYWEQVCKISDTRSKPKILCIIPIKRCLLKHVNEKSQIQFNHQDSPDKQLWRFELRPKEPWIQ